MGFILVGLTFIALVAMATAAKRSRERRSTLPATPQIVLSKKKRRLLAPYVFYLSGLRQNQLWALATLNSDERTAQANTLAVELKDILISVGFRRDLTQITSISPRRFKEMMKYLADEPAFAGVCARGLGLLMVGLSYLEELQEGLDIATHTQLDALVTDLMDTAIETLGESSA